MGDSAHTRVYPKLVRICVCMHAILVPSTHVSTVDCSRCRLWSCVFIFNFFLFLAARISKIKTLKKITRKSVLFGSKPWGALWQLVLSHATRLEMRYVYSQCTQLSICQVYSTKPRIQYTSIDGAALRLQLYSRYSQYIQGGGRYTRLWYYNKI